MTVKDLCTTFNGDDIHVFIFDTIKRFNDAVYDDSLTDGNIVDYDDYPSYDEKYNECEVVLWDLNYDMNLCEWILRIQIKHAKDVEY